MLPKLVQRFGSLWSRLPYEVYVEFNSKGKPVGYSTYAPNSILAKYIKSQNDPRISGPGSVNRVLENKLKSYSYCVYGFGVHNHTQGVDLNPSLEDIKHHLFAKHSYMIILSAGNAAVYTARNAPMEVKLSSISEGQVKMIFDYEIITLDPLASNPYMRIGELEI